MISIAPFLLAASAIVLLCVFLSKGLYRFGVQSLLIFMILGMLFGEDGFGIVFDDFQMAANISTFALMFIMFFGGFGTSWATARPIAVRATLLSSLGTVVTAVVTAICAMWVLNVDFAHGLLFGSVIASTDAASVFSILRSRKLNLKHNLAPMLEMESGSNDPFAYILTIVSVYLVLGGISGGDMVLLLFSQIGIGAAVGMAASFAMTYVVNRINLEIEGFYPLLILAFVILGYSGAELLGGNGLLCVYIIGIVSGNRNMAYKQSLVRFFDAISWLMQMLLFFVLGLLSVPSQLQHVAFSSILMSLILIAVSRPVAILSILTWFRVPLSQQMFVSWVGLRGAASIVFAIVAVARVGLLPYDIFHIVFFVALLSVTLQGSLMPLMAEKIALVEGDDSGNSVLKTFTDYQEEVFSQLMEYTVAEDSPLSGKKILEANVPSSVLIVMIKRGSNFITPNGSTKICTNDILVLSGDDFSFLDKDKAST